MQTYSAGAYAVASATGVLIHADDVITGAVESSSGFHNPITKEKVTHKRAYRKTDGTYVSSHFAFLPSHPLVGAALRRRAFGMTETHIQGQEILHREYQKLGLNPVNEFAQIEHGVRGDIFIPSLSLSRGNMSAVEELQYSTMTIRDALERTNKHVEAGNAIAWRLVIDLDSVSHETLTGETYFAVRVSRQQTTCPPLEEFVTYLYDGWGIPFLAWRNKKLVLLSGFVFGSYLYLVGPYEADDGSLSPFLLEKPARTVSKIEFPALTLMHQSTLAAQDIKAFLEGRLILDHMAEATRPLINQIKGLEKDVIFLENAPPPPPDAMEHIVKRLEDDLRKARQAASQIRPAMSRMQSVQRKMEEAKPDDYNKAEEALNHIHNSRKPDLDKKTAHVRSLKSKYDFIEQQIRREEHSAAYLITSQGRLNAEVASLNERRDSLLKDIESFKATGISHTALALQEKINGLPKPRKRRNFGTPLVEELQETLTNKLIEEQKNSVSPDSLKESLLNLENLIAAARDKADALTPKIEESKNEVDHLRDDLEKLVAAHPTLEDDFDHIQAEYDALEDDYQTKLENLRGLNRETLSIYKNLERQYEAEKYAYERLKESGAPAKISEIQGYIDKERNAYRIALKDFTKETNQKIAKAQETITSLKKQLNQKQASLVQEVRDAYSEVYEVADSL